MNSRADGPVVDSHRMENKPTFHSQDKSLDLTEVQAPTRKKLETPSESL